MSDLPTFSSYDGHFVSPRLAVGAWPRAEHIDEIVAAGVRGIVNLASVTQRQHLAYVHRLPEDVAWIQLGIWDGFLPEGGSCNCPQTLTASYARLLIQQAAIFMRDHAPLLVHCMGGQGRSGNVAALLHAADQGITPDQAQERISEHRRVAPVFHDGFWGNAGSDALVELARQVLNERQTPPELLRQRVRGETLADAPEPRAV